MNPTISKDEYLPYSEQCSSCATQRSASGLITLSHFRSVPGRTTRCALYYPSELVYPRFVMYSPICTMGTRFVLLAPVLHTLASRQWNHPLLGALLEVSMGCTHLSLRAALQSSAIPPSGAQRFIYNELPVLPDHRSRG